MAEHPLRILHLTAGSDAGGLSRYIYDLSTAMLARDASHQIAVAGERGAWHWLFEKAPFPWIDVPLKGGPLALRRAARTLDTWLQANPVDIIHSHYRRPTLVARKLQRDRRPPILYSVHLSDLKLTWPWRMFSDFGDHTHVASDRARRWVIDDGRVPAERVTLVPHGIDVTKFPLADEQTKLAARRALNVPEDARVVAYVGRLDYPKNEDWLLDAARYVSNVHLLMAGEGPHESRLRRWIETDGIADRVHLLGHRDPLAVYQAADLLALPSIREGFSLVCAEAMSVGVPVVRTRTAGTQELIVEGVTGRSAPIERIAFAEALSDMIDMDRAELRAMGQAASEHVRKNFTFDRQLEQTLALYRKVATLT